MLLKLHEKEGKVFKETYRFGFGSGLANSEADIGCVNAIIGHGVAIKLLFEPITFALALLT